MQDKTAEAAFQKIDFCKGYPQIGIFKNCFALLNEKQGDEHV
jgi:hypothetical protein